MKRPPLWICVIRSPPCRYSMTKNKRDLVMKAECKWTRNGCFLVIIKTRFSSMILVANLLFHPDTDVWRFTYLSTSFITCCFFIALTAKSSLVYLLSANNTFPKLPRPRTAKKLKSSISTLWLIWTGVAYISCCQNEVDGQKLLCIPRDG